MKTVLRKINVQGHEFRWAIKNGVQDNIFIRIWVVNQKSKPWVEIEYQFHNHWDYYGEMITYPGNKADLQNIFQLKPVTPGLVAGMIESLLHEMRLPEQVISTRQFVYLDEKLKEKEI